MTDKPKYYHYLMAVVFLTQCKEHFEANLPVLPQGYLVVEGFINVNGATQIKLSRTVPISDKKILKPELNATIQMRGSDNSTYPFTSSANGLYSSVSNLLDTSVKYRLFIKTKDNKEYLSDYVEAKITPPMDSISWTEENDGLQIYVTTHDDLYKSIYYRWEYDETWQIRSTYYHYFRYANGQIVRRDINEPDIFNCWKYDTLKNTILGSSEKLQNDIISLKPLVLIPFLSERIGIRYSIQVRQYVLDKEGYRFYELLKKNTESLGTIFDPQPSALNGNIHSVSDPNELVIGYVGATTMQQQRIFINQSQILAQTYNFNRGCDYMEVIAHPDTLAKYIPPGWPFDTVLIDGTRLGYKVTKSECVDCRLRGGINSKPSFW